MSDLHHLELYACEGGSLAGYRRAGLTPWAVDLFKHANAQGRRVGFSQKRCPAPSLQGDVIVVLQRLLWGEKITFADQVTRKTTALGLEDFVSAGASPPCQHASAGTRAQDRSQYPALIEPTRELLDQTGLPYVIENVEGAALRDPVMLCGTMFGLSAVDEDGTLLEMWRHRLFESNFKIHAPGECRHGWFSEQVAGSYGGARRDKDEARNVRHGGYVPSKKVQQELLGIDWMTEAGMHQSIPPAYTEHIGRQLIAHLGQRAA